jgi:DNA-3-methyladenine glycosylase
VSAESNKENQAELIEVNSMKIPGRLLKRAFFEASPEHVAPRLLGKLLVRRIGERKFLAGRIVEVEAYLGPQSPLADAAAHGHRGETARNSVLFGPPGHAYVYFIYGSHYCMNVSCEGPGDGGGILVRALEPVVGLDLMAVNRGLKSGEPARELTSGPGRLCEALGITRAADNGLDLIDPASPLQIRDDGQRVRQALVTRRIGIRHAADLPLRFVVPGNLFVSGPKSLARSGVLMPAGSVHRPKPVQSLRRKKTP